MNHIGNINPMRYRGYYYDRDLGLYYLQSRFYDAQTGRFINADAYVSTGQGFKVTWGGDRLLQYHPGGGHHGPNTYWKVSSGEGGVIRIYND
jgi:RHS repeat-associated protein